MSNLTMLQRTFSLDDDHFFCEAARAYRRASVIRDFYIIIILQPYEKVDTRPDMFRIVNGACLHDIT